MSQKVQIILGSQPCLSVLYLSIPVKHVQNVSKELENFEKLILEKLDFIQKKATLFKIYFQLNAQENVKGELSISSTSTIVINGKECHTTSITLTFSVEILQANNIFEFKHFKLSNENLKFNH